MKITFFFGIFGIGNKKLYFSKFVSFVHAHIKPLDIEMFDVSLTCMVCYL